MSTRDNIPQPEIEYNPLRVSGNLPNSVRQILKRYRDGATAAQIAQLMAREPSEVRAALEHLESIGAAEQRGKTWHTFGALEPRRSTFVLANAPAWTIPEPVAVVKPPKEPKAPKPKPEPRKGGPGTSYTPEKAQRVIDAMRSGLPVWAAAKAAGTFRQTIDGWLKQQLAFRVEYNAALVASKIARNATKDAADPENARRRAWDREYRKRKGAA